MDAIDRLIAAAKESGIKQNHIARLAGLPATKVNKILKRRQIPTVPEFIDIARAIGRDPARLFTDGELVVDVDGVRAAHAAARQAAEILEGWLPDRPASLPPPVTAVPKRSEVSRAVSPVRAAANPNAELLVEFEEVRQQIPRRAWNRGARIIARAVGDSMDGGTTPIKDGELVFLKPTTSARNAMNHVALVRLEDGLYLKVFEKSGHAIRLVSTSGQPPMQLDARADSIQVYGYMVDQQKGS
jgi:transcriptional regulator with XRE-family HTH domain